GHAPDGYGPRRPLADAAVPATELGLIQLACARLGSHAPDIVMRPPLYARGVRSHRLYRNVTVDRSDPGSLCRPAHQSRLSAASNRSDGWPRTAPPAGPRGDRGCPSCVGRTFRSAFT